MKRIPSVALGRHLLVIAGLALASTVGNLSAADTYYVSDHLATTTAVADATGEIASLEADAFGSPVTGGDQAARYTGKPYDADIGAYVFPFRNYRSDEARWMSADPSGFPDGINSAKYVDNPLMAFDPLGLAVVSLSISDSSFVTSTGNTLANPPSYSGRVTYEFDSKGEQLTTKPGSIVANPGFSGTTSYTYDGGEGNSKNGIYSWAERYVDQSFKDTLGSERREDGKMYQAYQWVATGTLYLDRTFNGVVSSGVTPLWNSSSTFEKKGKVFWVRIE